MCISFTSLVKYFSILFDAIVNGTFFSISLPDSLRVCRNTHEFYMLVFIPTTELNDLFHANNFLVCKLFSYGFVIHYIFCILKEHGRGQPNHNSLPKYGLTPVFVNTFYCHTACQSLCIASGYLCDTTYTAESL